MRSGERRVAGSVLARRARVVVVAAALASVVRRRRRRRPLEGDHVQAQVLAENGMLKVFSFRYEIVD